MPEPAAPEPEPAAAAPHPAAPEPTAPTTIERRLELAAAPDRVWRALTEPSELAAWFGSTAELDLRPGGEGWFGWQGDGRFHVRVVTVEPPTRLAWRWAREASTPVEAGESTLVEWRLTERADGGTTLDLRETGFTEAAWRDGNVWGWLDELSELLGHVAEQPWEAGIHRKLELRATPDAVWRALATIDELDAWWGPTDGLEATPGSEGHFVWEGYGRFAARIEVVEPPRYLAWRWATEPDVALADAREVLLTEWVVVPRDDGGTDLHLLETGFTGERSWKDNSGGWDGDVFPVLRRHLGEPEPLEPETEVEPVPELEPEPEPEPEAPTASV